MSISGRRTRTPRAELLGAWLLLAACECALAEIPKPDGGEPPADSGTGGGGETCRPAQCPHDAGLTCPFATAPDAGPSCIEGACVNECFGGRTCEVTDGGACLRCGTSLKCAPASCTAGPRCTFGVSGSSCTGLLDDGARYTVTTGADCRQTVSGDAGVIGSWFELDVGESVANIPRLGGYCTMQDLFTGVPRTQVFCPFCSFVAEGCD